MENIKDCYLFDNCNHADCDKSFCVKKYKLDYLYDLANVSVTKRKHMSLVYDANGTDFDEFTKLKKIQDNILNFVSDGDNLYIYSRQAGNGKTSWSLRLLQSFFNKIWEGTELRCRGLFISVPQFLLALKDNITNKSDYIAHIKENVLDADLVIWDDIATKTTTVFEGENLLSLIDSRINNGKANIYTSNLNEEELHTALGDRLASRIANLSINVELKGTDKRGLKYE